MNEVSAEDTVLELTQGWPFTVFFDACFAFMASHCFNLPCLHVQ